MVAATQRRAGRTLGSVEFQHLERLMAEAVREAENLDFKEALYADTDATKDELAADIASFANHRGGIILLGVAEADGAASGLPGVAVSDGEERRMTQIVAARVSRRARSACSARRTRRRQDEPLRLQSPSWPRRERGPALAWNSPGWARYTPRWRP